MSELESRWSNEPTLVREVINRLRRGREVASVVGIHDGRADLRGFRLPEVRSVGREYHVGNQIFRRVAGRVRIRQQRWESLDLSGSVLSGVHFVAVTFRDVRFSRANLSGSGLWGCTVEASQFVNADLRNVCLSSGENPSRWHNSVISSSDLRGATIIGGEFVDTDISSPRTDGISFTDCSFVDVRLTGKLSQLAFDNRSTRGHTKRRLGIDLSGAALIDVDFRGWKFDQVRLPDGVSWYPRQVDVLGRVLELAERSSEVAAPLVASVVRNSLRGVHGEDVDGLYNRGAWRSYDDTGDIARLFETMLSAALSEMGLRLL